MTPNIRAATATDAEQIYALHCAAFPSDGEAALVEALALDGDVVVSLVAEVDGAIVAHALFSRMKVTGDGQPITAAGLAPVATHPDHQRQGYAAMLIDIALAQLESHGTAMSFVLGDPAYYTRFGYAVETAAPFASPYAGPYFMARILDKALPLPKSGVAHYAPAFSQMEE
jgi:putative acetyltransferase